MPCPEFALHLTPHVPTLLSLFMCRHKLNDAITLHEIHDQAQEKAAMIKEQVELDGMEWDGLRQGKQPCMYVDAPIH